MRSGRAATAESGRKVGCIVLAAGRSTRMGANKLVAELAGKPVIAHAVDAIVAAGFAAPVVVLGEQPDLVQAALEGRGVVFVTAHDHAEGMARSLAAGIEAVPEDWTAAIICLGDMPMITAGLLRQLASMAGEGAIVVPRHDGHRGNPVLWGRDYFPRLAALSGDAGAKTLFAEYADRISHLDWDDDSVRIDVDRPEELAVARQRMGRIGGP